MIRSVVCLFLVCATTQWQTNYNWVTYQFNEKLNRQEIRLDGNLPMKAGSLFAFHSAIAKVKPGVPVILFLNSGGGSNGVFKWAIDDLRQAAAGAQIITYVDGSSRCSSACVGIYMAGDIRKASPTAKFGFHAARDAVSNELLAEDISAETVREWNVSEPFVETLRAKGVFRTREMTFLTGAELLKIGLVNEVTESP